MRNRSQEPISVFRRASLLALIGFLGAITAHAQTNLVTNGSFETPVVPPGATIYTAGTTFDGWTVGTNSIKHLNGIAVDGVQSVDLNGTDPGSVFQDVTTAAGQIYVLRFAIGGDPAVAGVRTLQVNWDSQVDTVQLDTTGNTDHGWTYVQYTVIGSGTNHLAFASLTPGTAGPELDNVSVQPDDDGDQVPNDKDLCPNTPLGEVVDANGCSISQLVPCEGPATGGTWKNHGQYVSSVAHAAQSFVDQGLISEEEKGAIVSAAAKSDCGQKTKPPKGNKSKGKNKGKNK